MNVLTDGIQPMSDTQECDGTELGLNGSLNFGVGFYVDIARCFVLAGS